MGAIRDCRPRKRPLDAPCWRSTCDVCGHALAFVVRRDGRLASYCGGCVRNAERRALHLPELSWFVLPTPAATDERPEPARRAAPLRTAHVSPAYERVLNLLPARPECALPATAVSVAARLHRSFAMHILRVLAAEGRAQSRLGPSQIQPGRAIPLWFRLDNTQPTKKAA